MIHFERLVQTFLELCNISSPSFSERLVGDYIQSYCERLGLSVKEDDAGKKIGGNCGNLIVHLPGRDRESYPRLFLSAHMDTVESTEGIKIIRKEGVISTNGETILGADDKMGVASILEAVHSLVESEESYAEGFLFFTVAEEKGLLGASYLERSEILEREIDFGLVFDTGPEVGCMVLRTPFHFDFSIKVEGVAAHAGKEPEKGVNAICLVSSALSSCVQGRVDEDTTCNFGTIRGGERDNIVCPAVILTGEVRSFSNQKALDVLYSIEKEFDKVVKSEGGKYKFDMTMHAVPYHHGEEARVVKHVLKALERISISGVFKEGLGSSDANIWNSMGIPCINIGVGMRMIHTHQEHCYEKDLLSTSEIIRSILQLPKNIALI